MNNIIIENWYPFKIDKRKSAYTRERFLHAHSDCYEILVIKSGNVDYFINHSTFHLFPGDIIFISPNEIHGFFVKDDSLYERFPLHLHRNFLESVSTEETDLTRCFLRNNAEKVLHLGEEDLMTFERIVDEIQKEERLRAYGYDIRIKHRIIDLIFIAHRAGTHDQMSSITPPLIRNIILYIDKHLTEQLNLKSIAEELHISVSRLSHAFKDYTGISLWNYIILRRIRLAQKHLRQGKNISCTCHLCGFHDYAHFSKSFHRICGMTPKEYQKETGKP